MLALVSPVRRFPLLSFTLLACAFGWIPYLVAALGVEGEAGNTPFGPVLAAAVVASCQGRDGLRRWWGTLRTWGSSPWLYGVALVAPVVIVVGCVAVNHLLGAPLPTGDQLGTWPEVPVTFVLMLVMVGIGEEAGWTAFAAPIVLRRHGLLVAWLVLGGIRLLWHLPLLLTGELSWFLGVGTVAFQLVVLQLVRRGAGWGTAAVWHAALNATGGAFFFSMVVGGDNLRLGVLLGVAYALVAAATLLLPAPRPDVVTAPAAGRAVVAA